MRTFNALMWGGCATVLTSALIADWDRFGAPIKVGGALLVMVCILNYVECVNDGDASLEIPRPRKRRGHGSV